MSSGLTDEEQSQNQRSNPKSEENLFLFYCCDPMIRFDPADSIRFDSIQVFAWSRNKQIEEKMCRCKPFGRFGRIDVTIFSSSTIQARGRLREGRPTLALNGSTALKARTISKSSAANVFLCCFGYSPIYGSLVVYVSRRAARAARARHPKFTDRLSTSMKQVTCSRSSGFRSMNLTLANYADLMDDKHND